MCHLITKHFDFSLRLLPVCSLLRSNTLIVGFLTPVLLANYFKGEYKPKFRVFGWREPPNLGLFVGTNSYYLICFVVSLGFKFPSFVIVFSTWGKAPLGLKSLR